MANLQLQSYPAVQKLSLGVAGLLAVVAIIASCSAGSNESGKDTQAGPPAPAITTTELKGLVDAGEEIFLLDVRRDSEFVAERLSFTDLRITHDSLEFYLDRIPQDKTTRIYCFCRGGVRSDHAARYLISIGYQNAYNVSGGMLDWSKNGFETVSGPVQ